MASVVRERQKALRALYKEDPARAKKRYVVRSAPGDLGDAFGTTVRSETARTAWRIEADHKVGGPGEAPSPGDFFLAALAGCQDITFRMVASSMGVTLTALEVEVVGDVDVRGALMIAGEVPIGFAAVRCETRFAVAPDTPRHKVELLVQAAENLCAVGATIRSGLRPELVFTERT